MRGPATFARPLRKEPYDTCNELPLSQAEQCAWGGLLWGRKPRLGSYFFPVQYTLSRLPCLVSLLLVLLDGAGRGGARRSAALSRLLVSQAVWVLVVLLGIARRESKLKPGIDGCDDRCSAFPSVGFVVGALGIVLVVREVRGRTPSLMEVGTSR